MEFFNLELGNEVAFTSSWKAWERAVWNSKTYKEAEKHMVFGGWGLPKVNPIKGPGASVQNPVGLR